MTAAERTALDAGLHIIVPVWGREYTQIFIDLLLPTLLAPGNIPALPHPERHVFQIYTTLEDRAMIEASPVYRRLIRHIRVAFHRVRVRDPFTAVNRFSVQSDCYRRAIREADAADQAMVFLTPDSVMADGSLRNLAAIAGRPGVRTIYGPGVRLIKEPVQAHLLRHHRVTEDGPIIIAPRELVRVMLDNLHPIAKAHFFRDESAGDGLILANLYWRAGAEGLVARCFYLHPFMVYPRVKYAEFTNTVDSDYVEAACPDASEAYIIADSDEFCACELSTASRTQKSVPRNDARAILKWMLQWTTSRHRSLINAVVRIHTGVRDQSLWHQAERQAQEDVASLLSLLYASGAGAGTASTGYVDAAKSNVPLVFATAVGTAEDARNFVDVALPSLLAPANLAAQIDKQYFVYRIDAAPEARAIIEAAPAFAELQGHIRVELQTRDAAAMAADGAADAFRRRAIAAAQTGGAAVMFIDPDIVMAENSFQIIRFIMRRGMRAILVPRLRLRRATAAAALRRDYWIEGVLSIDQRELVRLALDHLHPLARAQFPEAGEERADPSTLCWQVGDEGVLIHAFDYYPLVIHPGGAASGETVDHPLLGSLGFGPNEISIIRDSKVLVVCQLSGDDVALPLLPGRDPMLIAAWAARNAGAFSRAVFRNEIRLLAVETPSPRWQAVSAQASSTVLEILAGLEAAGPGARRA